MRKFKIEKSTDKQYYFTLQADNDEIIATSEMYTTKQSCTNGIDSVKKNASDAPVEVGSIDCFTSVMPVDGITFTLVNKRITATARVFLIHLSDII